MDHENVAATVLSVDDKVMYFITYSYEHVLNNLYFSKPQKLFFLLNSNLSVFIYNPIRSYIMNKIKT